jgi:hypothetical protein
LSPFLLHQYRKFDKLRNQGRQIHVRALSLVYYRILLKIKTSRINWFIDKFIAALEQKLSTFRFAKLLQLYYNTYVDNVLVFESKMLRAF